jgi:hypothetical protein
MVFSVFDQYEDILENQKEVKQIPLFSNGNSFIIELYTSSYQTSLQKQYYLDLTTAKGSKNIEFSIAYGHIHGSGSMSGSTYTYPSKAIYSQYKQLLLEPQETSFKFSDGTTSDSIYVINFKRERFRHRIDPGNWSLMLSELDGSNWSNNEYTGSKIRAKGSFGYNEGTIYRFGLYDDSNISYDNLDEFLTPITKYNVIPKPGLVQRTNGEPVLPTTVITTSSFGLIYPYLGIIVLDANKLNTYFSFNTVTGSNINGDNPLKLFTSLWMTYLPLNGAEEEEITQLPRTSFFSGYSNEILNSSYYFCNIKNTDFNFSTNPSFTSGSLGDLRQKTMVGDPKVFITTVGLYTKNQELVAVAKLSKPILKTFYTEAIIKVKINW